MTKSNYCQLWLTCADKKEADKIARHLLACPVERGTGSSGVKHLVVCAKQLPLTADYLWQGKIEHSDEVLLIMESHEDLFDQIEAEVAKLHSYDTFVLETVPTEKVSSKAEKWWKDEMKK